MLSCVPLAVFAIASGAGAQCYEVTAVIQGPPDPIFGPPVTVATSLNDAGDAVGYYFYLSASRAFLWRAATSEFVTLPRPIGYSEAEAYEISNDGSIVGSLTVATTGRTRAALWQGNQVFDLGTLPGGNYSRAAAINDLGQIVGTWGNNITGDPGVAAFLWDGTRMNLDLPMGPNSEALDLNELSQIVGWMGFSSVSGCHAYLSDAAGVMDLGPVPDGLTSKGNAVNASLRVVGSGQVPAEGYPFGLARAFRWDNAMVYLGVPDGSLLSAALDLDQGDGIVGRAWGGAPDIGLIWLDGVMHDLNDLIPAGRGIEILIAHAINGRGQIACQGHDSNGDVIGVILTPAGPAPADVNADGVVNVLDLIDILLCFGQPGSGACEDADVNGDGVVNVLDLIELLVAFGSSCP